MSDTQCLDEPTNLAANGVQVANHLDTNAGRPLPHLSGNGRLGCHEPTPGLLGGVRQLVTDSDPADRQRFVFTIGRGNDVEVAAIQAVAPLVLGQAVDALLADMGATWRSLVYDSPLRWLGPEKGVMHMAIGAVINALLGLEMQAGRVAACGSCWPR